MMNNFIDEHTLCEENLNTVSLLNEEYMAQGNIASMTEDNNLRIRNMLVSIEGLSHGEKKRFCLFKIYIIPNQISE